jgi:hypothetical protein
MAELERRPVRRVGSVRPRVAKPTLRLADFLRAVPAHPITVDNTTSPAGDVVFGLDHNDQFGVCVPTGLDNLRRLVTKLLTGTQVDASWDDVQAWYRTQNPDFDERDPGGPGDQGMVIQDFLAWAVKQGLILGFAEVDAKDDEQVQAAIYLFLGLHCGAMLQLAQNAQTDTGRWDYDPDSGRWGGHCIVAPAYEAGALVDVITWRERVATTRAWRQNQLDEAYVVLLPEHVAHPGFRAGFDLPAFAAAFTQLTGRPFPSVPPAPPGPPPHPGALVAAARALAADQGVARWAAGRHSGETRKVARLVGAVLDAAKNPSTQDGGAQ